MYWNAKDIDTFIAQKEFIDTAIVPLVLVDGTSSGMKQSASSAEFLMTLTSFIEQQFKGRVVLTPPFAYTQNSKKEDMLKLWYEDLKEAGFRYIFFITSDHAWAQIDPSLDVIWLPSIPLEHMDKSVKQSVLEDQIRQVIPMFSSKWSSQ